MRWITRPIALLRSLGALGIILVLCLASLSWAFYNAIRVYAAMHDLYETIQAQATATDVQVHLFNQGVNERDLLSSGDPAYLDRFLAEADETDTALASLQSTAGRLGERGRTVLDTLSSAQTAHRQKVVEIAAAIASGDPEQARGRQDELAAEQEQMREQVQDLLYEVETALGLSVRQIDHRIQSAFLAGITSLIELPLLVLWAFAAVGRGTQPILVLTNATVAIEGGQFNPEHLADVRERRDELGRLARAMEQMAHTVEQRHEQLREKVAELRAQRYEARRRKLLPTLPRRDDDTP
jgi:CHASE3 domain sensor protein